MVFAWFGGAGATMVCTAVAVVALCLAPPGQPVRVGSIRGVEARTGVSLPADVELVEAWYVGSLIQVLQAKIRMPRAEAEAFLSCPPFEGPPSREERFITNALGIVATAEWHPDTARNVLSTGASNRLGTTLTALWVMADVDDPVTANVYLLWNMP